MSHELRIEMAKLARRENVNVLIVDTETNGTEPTKDQMIEIGAILYSVEHRTTLCQLSFLLEGASHNNCEHINGIPFAALQRVPIGLAERQWDQQAKHLQCIALSL